MTEVHVQINGLERVAEVASNETLADLLRDRLRLTGTRIGCEQGVCGACTVLLDGEPVRSCLVLAVQVDGRVLETVEGLGVDPIGRRVRSEEHTSELQSLMRISYAVFCMKKKKNTTTV